MTLDEAIRHAEEVAEEHEKIKCIKAVTLEECKCASEHRKLAEWLKDYKRLKEQEPCDDAISRQAVLDTIGNVPDHDDGMVWEALSHAQRDVALLPPVNPQPKTGHWIDRSEGGRIKYPWMESNECSKCGENGSAAWNYCPNCGAKMIESHESEE